jgi:hypothetical protein
MQLLNLDGNPILETMRKSVQVELLLAGLRCGRTHAIQSSHQKFDDVDISRIAQGIEYNV